MLLINAITPLNNVSKRKI